jgi:pimeloyl-ACP methyl ester carboxylesterase
MEEKFTIKNRKGLKMVVVIKIPEKPTGLAFIMHGLGGFKEQPHIQVVANSFYGANFISVLFDTTNSIGESEGDYQKATIEQYYQDFEDLISWSKNQPWYQEPFFIAGHSLGGYSVVRFAETYPELIRGLFAFAPLVSGEMSMEAHNRFFPEETAKWKKTSFMEKKSESKPGLIKILPWSHMEERLKHNLIPNISKIKMPILIVVGEKDTAIPPDHQKVLFDAIINDNKEMFVVSGAPHTFRDTEHLTQLKNIFDNWLREIK